MCFAVSGCAFTVRANRPLTNALDRAIAPTSTGAKVAMAPIAIPVGFVSLTTDAVVIHPIRVIPRAYTSTANLIWRRRRGSFLRESFLFLPREAGEILLQKILAEPLPPDRINLYLTALLQIGDPDQIRRLTERIKAGG